MNEYTIVIFLFVLTLVVLSVKINGDPLLLLLDSLLVCPKVFWS